MSEQQNRTLSRAVRIAFAGDSITWVDGMLDEGFVGEADAYIRGAFAETIVHDRLTISGKAETIRSRKFYGESAVLLTGTGSGAAFKLSGDELSVVQASERSNDSAALIELYVDSELYDTFTNYNEAPSGEEVVRFVADGTTVAFDLGRPFTYAHRVTVNGREASGELNSRGYGAAFPASLEYRVIRQYSPGRNGEPEVRHALRFREPPGKGTVIEAAFRFGETVAYAKTSVGETTERLGSPLESRYGEGGVAFDPARPVAVSSGLDFRATDERAVRTWRFPQAAERAFELKIRGFDPRGGGKGEPYFLLNFVTNRFHPIMNAGIGGWTANLFNNDQGLRSTSRLSAWRPDIVFIGLGTNDDWETGNGFAASRRLDGLTEADVRRLPVLFVRNCRCEGPDRYSVDTAELLIAEAAERSVSIDGSGVVFDGVKSGDIAVIGDYYGDNRNVQCRLIASWDPLTRTATFDEPLVSTDVTPHIGSYAGQAVRIKKVGGYVAALERMIRSIRSDCPQTRIALFETGLSNFYTRLLTGYPEMIRRIAERNGCERVDVYRPLLEWQYGQQRDKRAYIGPDEAVTSTGAVDYSLLSASGRDVVEEAGYQLRNWSVKVNGRERYGDACRIEGGFAIAFRNDLEPEQMTIEDWNGRSRNPKMTYRYIPSRLVFTQDVPERGALIEVSVSSAKWSLDDAHLNLPGGKAVYGRQVKALLERMLPEAARSRVD
ncbi:MAG: hypothetical protein K0R28_4318 [Paenibacillus sp.]|jgi:hypothetical protein|nr:hypothetical protein [Paenibacillus sp.]